MMFISKYNKINTSKVLFYFTEFLHIFEMRYITEINVQNLNNRNKLWIYKLGVR